MPVTDQQRIEVPLDFGFRSMGLDRAAHDRAECANDAVAALDAEAVAVGQQEAMAEHGEVGIALGWDHKLHPLILAEVAFEIAVDVPFVRREHALLHLHLLGRATMITCLLYTSPSPRDRQ